MFYFKRLNVVIVLASFAWGTQGMAMDEADSQRYGRARASERQQLARLQEEKERLTSEIVSKLAQMKIEMTEAQTWVEEETARVDANYAAAKRKQPSDRLDLEYSQARFDLAEYSLRCETARLTVFEALTSLLNENGE